MKSPGDLGSSNVSLVGKLVESLNKDRDLDFFAIGCNGGNPRESQILRGTVKRKMRAYLWSNDSYF